GLDESTVELLLPREAWGKAGELVHVEVLTPLAGAVTHTLHSHEAHVDRLALLRGRERRHGHVLGAMVDLLALLLLDEVLDLVEDRGERWVLDDIQLLGRH